MIIFKIVVSNTQTKTVQFKYSFELNGLGLWMESGELASGWIYFKDLVFGDKCCKTWFEVAAKTSKRRWGQWEDLELVLK